MKIAKQIFEYLLTIYSKKEALALTSFFGEIEHLKLLKKDLDEYFEKNGTDFTSYTTDQIIALEFRISLLFSFFHICLEYKTRTAFKSAVKKHHIAIEEYFNNFPDEMYEKLRIYRNKTFHENADFLLDVLDKKKLDVKNSFDIIDEKITSLIKIASAAEKE